MIRYSINDSDGLRKFLDAYLEDLFDTKIKRKKHISESMREKMDRFKKNIENYYGKVI